MKKGEALGKKRSSTLRWTSTTRHSILKGRLKRGICWSNSWFVDASNYDHIQIPHRQQNAIYLRRNEARQDFSSFFFCICCIFMGCYVWILSPVPYGPGGSRTPSPWASALQPAAPRTPSIAPRRAYLPLQERSIRTHWWERPESGPKEPTFSLSPPSDLPPAQAPASYAMETASLSLPVVSARKQQRKQRNINQ